MSIVNGAPWTRSSATRGGPFPRWGMTACAVGRDVFLFGGCRETGSDIDLPSSLHVLHTAGLMSWATPAVTGSAPPSMTHHTAVLASGGDAMVVFGGMTPAGPSNALHVLNTKSLAWKKPRVVGTRAPIERSSHAAALLGGGAMLVHGGVHTTKALSDTWLLDTVRMEWEEVEATGDVPPARFAHRIVAVSDTRALLFGGCDDASLVFSDLYEFDLTARRWTRLEMRGECPPPAFYGAATYHDGHVMVFGGRGAEGLHGGFYELDVETLEWSHYDFDGAAPAPREGHSGVLVGNRWWILGGKGSDDLMAYMHALDVIKAKESKQIAKIVSGERKEHAYSEVAQHRVSVAGRDSVVVAETIVERSASSASPSRPSPLSRGSTAAASDGSAEPSSARRRPPPLRCSRRATSRSASSRPSSRRPRPTLTRPAPRLTPRHRRPPPSSARSRCSPHRSSR
jgi:hypothetical protein